MTLSRRHPSAILPRLHDEWEAIVMCACAYAHAEAAEVCFENSASEAVRCAGRCAVRAEAEKSAPYHAKERILAMPVLSARRPRHHADAST